MKEGSGGRLDLTLLFLFLLLCLIDPDSTWEMWMEARRTMVRKRKKKKKNKKKEKNKKEQERTRKKEREEEVQKKGRSKWKSHSTPKVKEPTHFTTIQPNIPLHDFHSEIRHFFTFFGLLSPSFPSFFIFFPEIDSFVEFSFHLSS